jgi:hypothetical protein
LDPEEPEDRFAEQPDVSSRSNPKAHEEAGLREQLFSPVEPSLTPPLQLPQHAALYPQPLFGASAN